MKKGVLILVIFLIGMVAVGWIAAGSQITSKNSEYTNYITEADAWVERGLYQRAIANYDLAAKENESEKLYEKMNAAYFLRYQEAPEDTADDYMDFLQRAVSKYPANAVLVNSFIDLYYPEEEYAAIYDCIVSANNNGYESDALKDMLLEVRYAFKFTGGSFMGIKQSVDNYAVKNERGWNTYSMAEGYMLSYEYDYISPCSADGIFVATGADSRLMNSDGMVLGIFESKVSDAGLFSEELIPACCGGKYRYYNEFAEAQFGDYEMAGTFQEGTAAVKKGGKWYLIDNKGEIRSNAFNEIVLDYMGRYIINGIIIAKSGGDYGLYDSELNLIAKLDCEAVDCHTYDGMTAICKNGKWGFVNDRGETVIKCTYDGARSFSNGLAGVLKDGKWGFIDRNGSLVIDYQFADVGYMSAIGICPVRTDLPEESIDKAEGEIDNDTGGSETDVHGHPPDELIPEKWRFLKLILGIKED